ncbi:MAG: hypothetical protein KDK99_21680, partial [Verrucomicrobiales bacterium]|nr:hypothetical protein [Verrucomicrobiales bacterium]
QTMYAGKLEELKAEATQAGQLNRVLAIKSEADAFRSGETPAIGDDFPKLKNLQSIYRQALPTRLQQASAALAPLTASYETKLKEMQVELTKQEKLTDALQVKAVLDALTANRAEVAAAVTPQAALQLTAPGSGLGSELTFRQGRLHHVAGTTEGTPKLDISAAEGITDFIDVAINGPCWAALRADGSVVGWNLKKGRFDASGITNLILRSGGPDNDLHAINNSGSVVSLLTGEISHDAGNGPKVTDAAIQIIGQNLVLLEDGTVKAWGSFYGQPSDPNKKFPTPPAEALKNIVAIGAARYCAWTVNREGQFFGWGENEWMASDIPREMRQATNVWGMPMTDGLVETQGKTLHKFRRNGTRIEYQADLGSSPSMVRCCEYGALGLSKGKWQPVRIPDKVAEAGLEDALSALGPESLPLLWLTTDKGEGFTKARGNLLWLSP